MKKIDDLKSKDTFRVPEDYFDSLTDNIMSQLPKKELIEQELPSVTRWDKLKPLVYLAAVFIGAALIIRVMMPQKEKMIDLATNYNIEDVSDEFIQETVDGALFDDYSLHVYLTNYSE
ncbi:hypothetical protein Bcop_2420 [Bacteroides coprosuis DSM 18011]|uniref:Uncharacterized protein n=1 Tax=Bacteroides coprosuis DSM 18011 TaxID=679937 RepID=F3ZNZ9_9BACE|nr:hypothetical protein [Bacteroides coprosuis]EGJ72572.1 hypothetical protein Bcop_2420 [Bacteroides coprosuis DSM 18011]HJD91182.1 hypothetical protein [Bacteroides coprosuis]